MIVALRGKLGRQHTADEYFLSSRDLPWYSIAFSTIATNIQGYQFLGMMGSAYLYGLAQANLEINAVQGILIAAFVFAPLFIRQKITTITQFVATNPNPYEKTIAPATNLFLNIPSFLAKCSSPT